MIDEFGRLLSPHAWDENTSHIADNEMARLNIEISAGDPVVAHAEGFR